MKNYLLWNMFSNIKNGQLAQKSFIIQRKKQLIEQFLNILWDEGFIIGYKVSKTDKKTLKIFLKYNTGKPVINTIKFISKPSRKIYFSTKQLWKLKPNNTLIILSTNHGLLPDFKCKKLNIGGELFVSIN